MEILDYSEIIKEIIRKYDKRPEKWQVLMGRSPKGFYDIIFSNPEEVWQLKLDTIYKPNPLGFGAKLEIDSSKIQIENFPSYGFRPISSEILEKMRSFSSNEDLSSIIVNDIMKTPPAPIKKINEGLAAVGPYIQKPSIEPLSRNQKELSRKLDLELEKLMREKYYLYY